MSDLDPSRAVLPIVGVDPSGRVCGVYGSSWLARPGLLITCGHCLPSALPSGQVLAAARKDARGVWGAQPLVDVDQDARGYDLATAGVNFDTEGESWPRFPSLGQPGMDVWSFGYPLADSLVEPDASRTYRIFPRFVKGYVMRRFLSDARDFPRLELDMTTPPGLSGAPLLFEDTDQVIGVVYGTNSTKVPEEDPARLYTFGLAFDWDVLGGLAGRATNGKELAELM